MSVSRPSPTVAGALAVLASAQEPDGSPLSARTRRDVAAAIARARAEVLASLAEHGPAETARRLGVARNTLALWRAGWLA